MFQWRSRVAKCRGTLVSSSGKHEVRPVVLYGGLCCLRFMCTVFLSQIDPIALLTTRRYAEWALSVQPLVRGLLLTVYQIK